MIRSKEKKTIAGVLDTKMVRQSHLIAEPNKNNKIFSNMSDNDISLFFKEDKKDIWVYQSSNKVTQKIPFAPMSVMLYLTIGFQ